MTIEVLAVDLIAVLFDGDTNQLAAGPHAGLIE